MNWLIFISLWVLISGCAAKPQHLSPSATVSPGNLETLDTNKDERIDTWLTFEGAGEARLLVERRTDLNFDGKVDVTQHYEKGRLTFDETDMDFDGVNDMRTFYDDKGQISRSEAGFGFDGQTSVWRYYQNGVLLRKERDTNNDGKVDTWEYYENGKLNRTGKDITGDGVVDLWE